MASTNPFPRGESSEIPDEDDFESPPGGGARKRGAGTREKTKRRQSRGKLRQLRERVEPDLIAGWPDIEAIKPVLMFLAMPAFLVVAIIVTGGNWPSAVLYPIAVALGVVVAISTLRGVELVLAVLLIYLPFSKVFVIPIAPGVNGTNMLILLGLFAAVVKLISTRQKLTEWPAGTYIVLAFGFLTSLSAVTVSMLPGGRVYLMYNEVLSYKAWVDQFIFYFIVLMCVRDIQTAKRCVIYVMIGSVLVVLYSVPEMLDKSGRSTIDKSRIGGPHLQSNNFGGFVAYTLLPLLALFITYIKDIRMWLLTPYFLLALKVLITTFSRGAYVAMVVGALMAGWFKGKGFVAWWCTVLLAFLLVFPSFIPESIVARMESGSKADTVSSAASVEEKLDTSSAIRLVMWRAAAKMIEEDPIWGKGFKAFPYLKDDYINIDIIESDPHSMYLYIGAQMGLPSLSLFLVILGYNFWLGRTLSRDKEDKFIRAIGIGGAASTACFAVVCIFGSRAVSLNFTVYFWTYLVVMQVIRQKQLEAEADKKRRPARVYAGEVARQNATEQEAYEHAEAMSEGMSGAAHDHTQPDDPVVPFPTLAWRRKKPGSKERGPSRGAAAYQSRQRNTQPNNTQTQAPVENADTESAKEQHEPDEQSEFDSPLQRKSRRAKLKNRFP